VLLDRLTSNPGPDGLFVKFGDYESYLRFKCEEASSSPRRFNAIEVTHRYSHPIFGGYLFCLMTRANYTEYQDLKIPHCLSRTEATRIQVSF
jgi:hypothetical protein